MKRWAIVLIFFHVSNSVSLRGRFILVPRRMAEGPGDSIRPATLIFASIGATGAITHDDPDLIPFYFSFLFVPLLSYLSVHMLLLILFSHFDFVSLCHIPSTCIEGRTFLSATSSLLSFN